MNILVNREGFDSPAISSGIVELDGIEFFSTGVELDVLGVAALNREREHYEDGFHEA